MVKKISADFSSKETFQTMEQVDKFYNHYFIYNHTLANGTVNPLTNFYVVTISNGKTTLKVYTANNFTNVFTYNHN